MSHSLATSSLLKAVGVNGGAVGAAGATAAVKWITKDGIGALGRLLVGLWTRTSRCLLCLRCTLIQWLVHWFWENSPVLGAVRGVNRRTSCLWESMTSFVLVMARLVHSWRLNLVLTVVHPFLAAPAR